MNLTLRVFLIVLLLLQALLIINTVNKKGISMKYASLWLMVIVLLIISAIFPNLIIWLSPKLGFETTSNMVFLLGFFVIFYIVFILTLTISKQNEKIKTLIQELSILKEKVKQNEERK